MVNKLQSDVLFKTDNMLGDLCLKWIGKKKYTNPSIFNNDQRWQGKPKILIGLYRKLLRNLHNQLACIAISKFNWGMNSNLKLENGSVLRIVRHCKGDMFYGLLENGKLIPPVLANLLILEHEFGDMIETKLFNIKKVIIYLSMWPYGAKRYSIANFEEFTGDVWSKISYFQQSSLKVVQLAFAMINYRPNVEMKSSPFPYLEVQKGDILCVVTGPNEYGWLEAYKAEERSCMVGLVNIKVIHQIT